MSARRSNEPQRQPLVGRNAHTLERLQQFLKYTLDFVEYHCDGR